MWKYSKFWRFWNKIWHLEKWSIIQYLFLNWPKHFFSGKNPRIRAWFRWAVGASPACWSSPRETAGPRPPTPICNGRSADLQETHVLTKIIFLKTPPFFRWHAQDNLYFNTIVTLMSRHNLPQIVNVWFTSCGLYKLLSCFVTFCSKNNYCIL